MKSNVKYLKDPRSNKVLQITLINIFKALGHLDAKQDVILIWTNIKDYNTKTFKKVLRRKTDTKNHGYPKRTLNRIEDGLAIVKRWCSTRTKASKEESRKVKSQARKSK